MSAAAEISCRELVELVTDYFEGALPVSEHTRFEEHLVICDGCSSYVDQMRETQRAVGTLTEEAITPEARDKLLAAFRTWKQG